MEQQDDIRQAPGRTLAILGVGTLGFVLAQTTVIPALGEMQKELGASASGIAWMVTAYLLVASIATPIFGKLGDMFGKERLLAVSLAAFAVGSVVCALSDSLGLMIVGRGLQGLGGGVFPLSFGIIRDEFPADKVPTGIALLGAISAIGSGVGLPLGGVLTDGPGYHWIFWVAAIMGVLATITTIKFVPESPIRTPGRVDFVGAGILAVGLTALLIAISRGADWGWGSPETLGLIAAGLIVLDPVRRLRGAAHRAAGEHEDARAPPRAHDEHLDAADRLGDDRDVRARAPARAAARRRRGRGLRPERHRGRPAARAGQPALAADRAVRGQGGRALRLQAAVLRRLPDRRRRAAGHGLRARLARDRDRLVLPCCSPASASPSRRSRT